MASNIAIKSYESMQSGKSEYYEYYENGEVKSHRIYSNAALESETVYNWEHDEKGNVVAGYVYTDYSPIYNRGGSAFLENRYMDEKSLSSNVLCGNWKLEYGDDDELREMNMYFSANNMYYFAKKMPTMEGNEVYLSLSTIGGNYEIDQNGVLHLYYKEDVYWEEITSMQFTLNGDVLEFYEGDFEGTIWIRE